MRLILDSFCPKPVRGEEPSRRAQRDREGVSNHHAQWFETRGLDPMGLDPRSSPRTGVGTLVREVPGTSKALRARSGLRWQAYRLAVGGTSHLHTYSCAGAFTTVATGVRVAPT